MIFQSRGLTGRRYVPILTPLADAFKRFIRPSEVVTSFTPMWTGAQPQYTAWKYDKLVEEAYLRNELIFACIEAEVAAVNTISMNVYRKGSKEHLKDHPLQKLLARPNPYMTENDFWEHTVRNKALAGLAPWQKIRDGRGEIAQLWPLRPDKLGFKRSQQTFISGYAYRADDGMEYDMKPEQVFYFIHRDPRDMLKPVSRALIAGRQIDVDNAETDHMKKHWESGGLPRTALVSKNKLSPEQITRARQNWTERYGGYQNWDAPVVLDSDTSVQQLGFSFKDMGLEIIDGRTETRICMVMGVPPIVIATSYGLARSTYSNAETILRGWWENVNIPRFNKLADQVNLDLTPLWGSDIEARWDFSNVPALQSDRNDRMKRAALGYTKQLLKKNEARVEAGYEETDDPSGEQFMQAPVAGAGLNGRGPANGSTSDAELGGMGMDEMGTDLDGADDAAKQAAKLEIQQRVKRLKEQVMPQGEPLPHELAVDVAEFTAEEIASGEDRFRQLAHSLETAKA